MAESQKDTKIPIYTYIYFSSTRGPHVTINFFNHGRGRVWLIELLFGAVLLADSLSDGVCRDDDISSLLCMELHF